MNRANKKSPFPLQTPWRIISIFFLLSIGGGSAGYFYFQSEKKQIVQQNHEKLSAIADLKVKPSVDWRQERVADATLMGANHLIVHHIEEYWRKPGSSKARKELLEGMGLTLRFPVSEPSLPAAMAVRGETGILEGVDYRKKHVLAAIRRIPDSPWFLIAKVDEEEEGLRMARKNRRERVIYG